MRLSKIIRKKEHLPKKRAINFATVERKKKHYGWAAIGVLCVIVLAAAFSKYFVIDRMNAVFEKQKKVAEVQKEIDDIKAEINSFGEIQSDFEHNKILGLTPDELSFTNRLEILDLIDRVVFPEVDASSWTLSENTLRIPVTGASLQDINGLIALLEEEESVDYCDIVSAATGSDKQEEDQLDFFDMEDEGNGTVTGNLVIYMDSKIPDQLKPFLTGGSKK